MARWSGLRADAISTSIDGLARSGMAALVQRDALFQANQFFVGSTVRGAARAALDPTAGSPFLALFIIGSAVRMGAHATLQIKLTRRLPGEARAGARVLGTLANPNADTQFLLGAFEPSPEDPTAALAPVYVLAIEFVSDPPPAEPGPWSVPTLPASAGARLQSRTPSLRLLGWPAGLTMIYRNQGDVGDPLTLQLARTLDGISTAPPELATATLVQLRQTTPSGVVARTTLTVLDASRGLVQATLGAPSVAEPGPHALVVEVTHPGGLATYPCPGALTLQIQPLP